MSVELFIEEWGKCEHCGRETRVPATEKYKTRFLRPMDAHLAEQLGIYMTLYFPEDMGYQTAGQLIEPLKLAIVEIEHNPEIFPMRDGWSSEAHFLNGLRELLKACEASPDAHLRADRHVAFDQNGLPVSAGS
jgi:hypothetical protein